MDYAEYLLSISRRRKYKKRNAAALLPSQLDIWVEEKLHSLDTSNCFHFVAEVNQNLNINIFKKAIYKLAEGFESIRTVFCESGSLPYAEILLPAKVEVFLEDCIGWPDKKIFEVIKKNYKLPFNLSLEIPFRVFLYKQGESRFFIQMVIHHIAISLKDYVQIPINLGKIYQSIEEKRTFQRSGDLVPNHFTSDYKSFLLKDSLIKHKAYWTNYLSSKRYPSSLPFCSRTLHKNKKFMRGKHYLKLPQHFESSLRAVASENGVSFFSLMVSAFMVLLSRYTREDTIALGIPNELRDSLSIANSFDLLGCTINVLPLVVNIDLNQSFSALSKEVNLDIQNMKKHKAYPLSMIKRDLRDGNREGSSEIFRVIAVSHREKNDEGILDFGMEAKGIFAQFGNLKYQSVGIGAIPVGRFDLTFALAETCLGVTPVFYYNRLKFQKNQVQQLYSSYLKILEDICSSCQKKVADMGYVLEYGKNLKEDQQTYSHKQKESFSFLRAFELNAQDSPNAAALITEEECLDYRSLDEKSNQFARYLRRRGISPGSLVGVGLNRSSDLIVVLLGVIKAECTYVPIDPSHPTQRIRFILKDAGIGCLVTKSCFVGVFEDYQKDLILFDDERFNILEEKKMRLKRKVSKDHLAYVIYTSGSTGSPKGVEVFESALNNLIYSIRKQVQCLFDDRWLALTTISFDIASLEIYLPLSQGATVVLASDKGSKDAQAIIKLIDDANITIVQGTPSMWQMVIDGGWKGKQGLKILCGGESLPMSLAKELIKKGACLWNLYGPTETTVWSSMDRITASDQVITIGRPLDNTDLYILDEHQNVVPTGVQGELYIGGAGLARGYWNKKELTESKFIPSPFGRLYRTGDLVCRLQDGRIEYIGRLDNQVKIRGFRVELGEIEEVLRKVKGIEQAVVLAHEVKQGDVRLIAYFQGRALQTDLEEAASSFLPTYMCPNIYIKVDQFPLTPNQKIDRNALPLPANFKGSDNYEKPGSVYEEKIAEVFAYHLGLEKVSVDADFFSLGGHSLLVVQVVSEINKSFCIELPLNSLFEHPSVRELALQVESSLKSGERNKKPIEKYPKKGLYPLSPSQKRIWFAEQIAPSKTLYSIPQVLEISGVLDVEKFQKAIQAVFQNHEILNAVFKDKDGEPMQVIKGLSKSPFRYFDYSGKRSPEKKASRFLSLEAKKGFDLKKGPLSRFILIRVSNKKHFFFFNFHHIIFDGLSTNVFLQDVRRCYELSGIAEQEFFANHHPQYTDYISWERKKRVKSGTLSSVEFLKQKLKNISLTPFLPNDKERPKFLTHKGSFLNFLIKEKYADKIHSLVRENGTTLFTFMLTAFHILLARYSSQRELVIGVPSSGRDNVSLDSMIGCFINVLPFPTSSKGSETFIDLLKRFRKESSEMFKHAEVSFDHLSNELEIDRSLNYSPIFQVMLNLLPRTSVQKMGDLGVNLKQLDRGMSHFDLSLTIQESSTDIMGYLEYSTEIFSRKMANGISRHFQSLVKEITKDPYQSISQYQFLSPREIQEMTASWNSPTTEYNSKRTIVESFENQVAQTPKKIVVICGKEQLSYEELNREANKLAHTLLKKGIQPENKVVVCLDRTKEFIVAVLGILKSGAAYIPIDPQEPKDRAQSIFRDLAPSYVVTHSRVKLNFTYPNTLCLDQIDCLDTSNPSIRNLENHLAYIIYTSGSTGRPKGVEIEHGGINDRVMWKQTTYPLSSKDVMLHTYSFIFDGAIINYFWSLCAGSTLLIATNLEQYDPSALVQLIRKHRVSVTDMLPSLIHGVVEANGFEKCISLKYVFSGGEALSGEIVRMFYKNCSSATLYNTYGPTETTVEASVWECGPDFSGTVAPIGRPIAGAKLYVLDEHQNVVPTGVQGELYIGGKGLARSYLNDSKLTNDKFVNSPFDDGKLYRTGDLVKLNFEEDLEFLGRIDHQVKIRGYRIELGEIESTLLHMDQVERVAVVVDGKDIYKKIIAYVQLRPRMNESSFQPLMEQFLGKRLPGHMIPAQVVVMKDLPTLLNGKVNYKALPDPQKSAKAFSKSKERPTCENEIKLLSLWRGILDFADISINDNFFEIGGNSLLAMRLITRINKEMKASLPLVSLFHHPTIKSLVSFIKEPIKKQNKSTAVLMKGRGNKSPFFCVHPVGGNILCYNNLAKHWTSKRPLYGLQARGFEEKERPLKSIKSMAREYINSIKKIQKEGPYFVGGWSFGGHVASEITRQLLEKGDEVGALIIIDTSMDIDKFRGIDISSEQNLYSELLDYYNIDPKKDYENLSPKEKLFQLLEWGGQKTCSIEKNRIKCTLNVAKSNYRALQKLSISPIKNVPVVLLRAQSSLKEVHDLGWGKYAEILHIYSMPGNHWGIVDDCLSKSYALAIEKSINMACESKNLVGSRM